MKLDKLISISKIHSHYSISSFANDANDDEMKEKSARSCLSFMSRTTLIEYDDYFDKYIPNGRFISGTFDVYNDWIIVYQAFNKNIAEHAVKHQSFLSCINSNKSDFKSKTFYNQKRMTWIKPNFLWMMYRIIGHKKTIKQIYWRFFKIIW